MVVIGRNAHTFGIDFFDIVQAKEHDNVFGSQPHWHAAVGIPGTFALTGTQLFVNNFCSRSKML